MRSFQTALGMLGIGMTPLLMLGFVSCRRAGTSWRGRAIHAGGSRINPSES